jgi:predicted glycosyltransferase
MNLLFDIGHPAHVHLFRNFIFYLRDRGHNVFVVSRKKDVTEILLDHYNIEHFPVTVAAATRSGMLKELIDRNRFIFELHRKHHLDAAFGTSASIGFLRLKFGVPAYNFNEDDDDVVKLYSYLAYPPATKIFNPNCIRYKKWRDKRVLYPSYHELAYLHPDNFIPESNILKSYNLEPLKYVIIRLSALKAHHDIRIKGITLELLEKVKESFFEYRIVESVEQNKNHGIKPWDMHHIMAFAKLIISDSQTMTAETAVLGRPSLRVNDFVGRISYLEEMEHKYGLTFGFRPLQEERILAKVGELISGEDDEEEWAKKRKRLLQEKVELTGWMINYFGL